MADVLFYLKKALTDLVLPPLAPLVLVALGLVCLRRRPRAGLVLAWSGLVAMTLCSLPAVSPLLGRLVNIPSGLASDAAKRAEAVVVLGGGRQRAAEYGGETVSAVTLERVRYGAKLARDRGLPLLLSGGSVFQGSPEAELMDRALRESFGTSARWIERASRDTHQNALYSAAILQRVGIRTVLLVTHDYHQRRSVAEFKAAGIEPVSAPVTAVSLSGSTSDGNVIGQLPNGKTLLLNSRLLHEILGNFVQWMGR